MRALTLHLPNPLHQKLGEVAQREGVSINQFISSAVGEKMSALMTADLETRAKRASRRKFEAVLAKIPDVEPHKSDRIGKASRRMHQK